MEVQTKLLWKITVPLGGTEHQSSAILLASLVHNERVVFTLVIKLHSFVEGWVKPILFILALWGDAARRGSVADVIAFIDDVIVDGVFRALELGDHEPSLALEVFHAVFVSVGEESIFFEHAGVGQVSARFDHVLRQVAPPRLGIEHPAGAHGHAREFSGLAFHVVGAPTENVQIIAVVFLLAHVGKFQIAARVGHLLGTVAFPGDGVKYIWSLTPEKPRKDLAFAHVVDVAPAVFVRVYAVSSLFATGSPAAILSGDAVGSLAGSRQG